MLLTRAVVLTLIVFSLLTLPLQKVQTSFPKNITASPKDEMESVYVIESKKLDQRAQILADYLASYNSPLQYQAQDFIDAADTYGVDWKLVPSIAGVESTFGKFTPGGYNAWGWGVYGNQSLGFGSWREGIFTVTEGLKKNYIDKGLKDPYSMNKVYAASPHWGKNVSYFLANLESYAQNYPVEVGYQTRNLQTKTAGSSAQLAYKN